jgi:hypothetical protein
MHNKHRAPGHGERGDVACQHRNPTFGIETRAAIKDHVTQLNLINITL